MCPHLDLGEHLYLVTEAVHTLMLFAKSTIRIITDYVHFLEFSALVDFLDPPIISSYHYTRRNLP